MAWPDFDHRATSRVVVPIRHSLPARVEILAISPSSMAPSATADAESVGSKNDRGTGRRKAQGHKGRRVLRGNAFHWGRSQLNEARDY